MFEVFSVRGFSGLRIITGGMITKLCSRWIGTENCCKPSDVLRQARKMGTKLYQKLDTGSTGY